MTGPSLTPLFIFHFNFQNFRRWNGHSIRGDYSVEYERIRTVEKKRESVLGRRTSEFVCSMTSKVCFAAESRVRPEAFWWYCGGCGIRLSFQCSCLHSITEILRGFVAAIERVFLYISSYNRSSYPTTKRR